jgi:hypothetical protein
MKLRGSAKGQGGGSADKALEKYDVEPREGTDKD